VPFEYTIHAPSLSLKLSSMASSKPKKASHGMNNQGNRLHKLLDRVAKQCESQALAYECASRVWEPPPKAPKSIYENRCNLQVQFMHVIAVPALLPARLWKHAVQLRSCWQVTGQRTQLVQRKMCPAMQSLHGPTRSDI